MNSCRDDRRSSQQRQRPTRDVANVAEGAEPKFGDAQINGERGVILCALDAIRRDRWKSPPLRTRIG